jgi:hypothetical protein
MITALDFRVKSDPFCQYFLSGSGFLFLKDTVIHCFQLKIRVCNNKKPIGILDGII